MVIHFFRIKMGQNLKLTDPGNLLEVKGDRDMSFFIFFFFFSLSAVWKDIKSTVDKLNCLSNLCMLYFF